MDTDTIEQNCRETATEIFDRAMSHKPGVLEAQWWERQAVKWLSSDHDLKSRVLRFVDVFPTLKTNRQITKHLREYLPEESFRLPESLRPGRAIVTSALITPGAAAYATSLAIDRIAHWFIAGSGMEDIGPALKRLTEAGMTYTLDLLGEATLSDREADRYAHQYVEMIGTLNAARGPDDPPVNVSVKLSSLTPRFHPLAQEHASGEARTRLRTIMRAAMKAGALVNVDMESYALRDLTFKTFKDLLEEEEFHDARGVGIVMQSYLKDAEETLDGFLDWVVKNNRDVMIRLVKGAYWEQEQVTADQKRWPVPVRMEKADTDAAFERMTATLLSHSGNVVTAIGSHNIRSVAKAIVLARSLDVPKERFEIQMLYGMADEVKKALVEMDVPVRVYAPFGDPLPGMGYLVRRILENSSQESFLRHSFVEDRPLEELLADPVKKLETVRVSEKNNEAILEPDGCVFRKDEEPLFVNEPDPRYHTGQERDRIDRAIENVLDTLGRYYPCVVNGRRVETAKTFHSTDPSDPSRIVGEIAEADEALVAQALESAQGAFGQWSALSAAERMEFIMTAARLIRERKHELAAWQMVEVGKTRTEALADVDEAIDHINYYAIAGYRLFKPARTQRRLGETNRTRLIPRGPGVVISPWNFPLAILAGLTCSALAAGNTVVIKPSSSSAVTAAIFADILSEAGCPDGVVNFTPGPGGALGPALIRHPATTFVSFTGSFDVGASIVNAAGRLTDTRDGFIKVVAEMGGKNAVIVDESADLDEAVSGVVASAFGFGGQKCSACSRVIALRGIYKEFVNRLVGAVESLIIGSPLNPETNYGPLIDGAAVEKSLRYIDIGSDVATPLLVRRGAPEMGHFVAPAIFGDVPADSLIAMDEIFGPVLSVIPADSVPQAIDIANTCHYALTGGVYSRTPSTVERVMERFRTGNMYINRGITGAIVERQPFGGFKRSGMGSAKAGSADLVRELALPQTITENIVRHGFSPDMET